MQSQLSIPTIEEHVHLGCTPEERRFQHRVHFGVELFFAVPPQACTTDQMDKTPCYAEIAAVLAQTSREKHYATIEHLAQSGFDAVKKYLGAFNDLKITQLEFTVHKLNPPVPTIKGGAIFRLRQNFA